MPSAPAPRATAVPNELEAYWLPFTANRAFKSAPRLFAGAKDMHYFTPDGRKVIDATAGLWCVNAGHCREPIVEAIQAQAAELDYCAGLPVRPPQGVRAGEPARRCWRPADLDYVFFSNSGSEAVDTALKIALAYHKARGRRRAHPPDRPRARLPRHRLRRHLGRRHGRQPQAVRQHAGRRRSPAVDLRPRASRPSPRASPSGARIWPTSSSASSTCTTPPPSPPSSSSRWRARPACCRRPRAICNELREISDKHGILLIFDEVITGFGRLGHCLRRRALRRDARHDHLRQGRHQRPRCRWRA